MRAFRGQEQEQVSLCIPRMYLEQSNVGGRAGNHRLALAPSWAVRSSAATTWPALRWGCSESERQVRNWNLSSVLCEFTARLGQRPILSVPAQTSIRGARNRDIHGILKDKRSKTGHRCLRDPDSCPAGPLNNCYFMQGHWSFTTAGVGSRAGCQAHKPVRCLPF